jgi:hypothetical protein
MNQENVSEKMMKKFLKMSLILTLAIVVVFAFPVTHAFATAGGFHGGGGGSVHTGGYQVSHYNGSGNSNGSSDSINWLSLAISLTFLFGIMVIISKFGNKRQKIIYLARDPRQKNGKYNFVFGEENNPEIPSAQIRIAFTQIQSAWNNQKLKQAEQYYTEKLYKKHQLELDKLAKKEQVNKTIDVVVKGLSGYKKTATGFSIDISFVAIDYVYSLKTHKTIIGEKYLKNFKQTWFFIEENGKIKADWIKEIKI